MAVWLNINSHSGVPIYVQLIEQVKHALAVGILQSGDAMPTVRELATELAIAPNTIVKAYNELQRMGLIESRPGKGTVVCGTVKPAVQEQQHEALYERLRVLVRDAAGLGVSAKNLRACFESAMRQAFQTMQQEGEE